MTTPIPWTGIYAHLGIRGRNDPDISTRIDAGDDTWPTADMALVYWPTEDSEIREPHTWATAPARIKALLRGDAEEHGVEVVIRETAAYTFNA